MMTVPTFLQPSSVSEDSLSRHAKLQELGVRVQSMQRLDAVWMACFRLTVTLGLLYVIAIALTQESFGESLIIII